MLLEVRLNILDNIFYWKCMTENFLFLLTTSEWCQFRVRLSGMKIVRPPVAIGHYKMIKHKGDKGNEQNPRRYITTDALSLFLLLVAKRQAIIIPSLCVCLSVCLQNIS